MNDQERIRRAEQAKRILESALWNEAFTAFRQRQLDAMERADPEDFETVLRSKRMLAVIHEARRFFEMILQEGVVAAEMAKEQETRKKWYSPN